MDCICLGFNIDVEENLIILKTDRENINYIIQIEFDLLEELINLPSNQRINRLHIDDLRYTITSLLPTNTEEKLINSEEKAITSARSTFFYTSAKSTAEVATSEQPNGNTEGPSTLAVARGILANHI
jgi:hypothetical protein